METDNPENNRTNKQTFVTQSKSAVLLLYPYPCQCAGDLNSWTKFRRSCSCRPSSTISVFKYSTDAEVFRASRTNGDTSDNLKCEKPTNSNQLNTKWATYLPTQTQPSSLKLQKGSVSIIMTTLKVKDDMFSLQ